MQSLGKRQNKKLQNSLTRALTLTVWPQSPRVKIRLKVITQKKAHVQPLGVLFVQYDYENNPANAFRDIVQKRNKNARPDMVMTTYPTLLHGIKKAVLTPIIMKHL